MTILHLRVDGVSADVDVKTMPPDIQLALKTDEGVRRAAAWHMDRPTTDFNDSIIERHENGNMTLRPEAVFG